ncbi:NADH:flavin oxidoreductase/NADH oxidase [Xylaria bambusicola]|uniref:NADH:flavin oxidoreductase/NADH oxidase n=1 Tax=Xylaria bambusicola TaxID=326684 RepID=UPI002007C043|nr:NADH:flavin oxidoreductase/NADH oxidase [Xylaria bambusicola]KAI0505763.1 NADH:flavin oxidoreductase/NADH oxidase [Xylaria bambusicola]
MEHISQPLTLKCGLTLPNRLVKAAMSENMADKNNLPDNKFHVAYGKWAGGGWGMLLTGNVQVDAAYLGNYRETAVDPSLETQLKQAWKEWAAACNRHGTPTVMQLSHAGRQSPIGAGRRGLCTQTLAPSSISLDMGGGLLAKALTPLIFGTPREMMLGDIDRVVQQFTYAACLAVDAGFQGIQIHAAHGYLLSQFLSAKANRRTDEYGGSPANRARLVVRVLQAVREAVPASFCVGIKLNSVDHQSSDELQNCIEQLRLIVTAGVDFVEISGGTWEDPKMMSNADQMPREKSDRSKAREAFFLEFAKAIRYEFPSVPLLVTGGFRTRSGMREAIDSGDCDLIGIARPAVLSPQLPNDIVFNKNIPDEESTLQTQYIRTPRLAKITGIKAVSSGAESRWYSSEILKMGQS